MRNARVFWFLAYLSLAVMATAVSTNHTAAKPPEGKGGGNGGGNDEGSDDGGSGTALPPIVYEVQYFDFPFGGGRIYDSNSSAQVVGAYSYDADGDGSFDGRRGWLYDPADNHAVDLNLIVSDIPDGWEIYRAEAINELGDIGATIAQIAEPMSKKLQAAMIDMNASPPTLHVVPDDSISDDTLSADLTDLGDLLGSYRRADGTDGVYVYSFYDTTPTLVDLGMNTDWQALYMNNAGEIVGWLTDEERVFRTTVGGVVEKFDDLARPAQLNNLGEFCGTYLVSYKSWKNKEEYPYVYGEALEVFTDAQVNVPPRDINDSSDFIQRNHVYHQHPDSGGWGLVDVVAVLDPAEQQYFIDNPFTIWTMTERESTTDFPILHGTINGHGFMLVPVPAP